MTYSAALPAAVGKSCMKKLKADVLVTSLTDSFESIRLSEGREERRGRRVKCGEEETGGEGE